MAKQDTKPKINECHFTYSDEEVLSRNANDPIGQMRFLVTDSIERQVRNSLDISSLLEVTDGLGLGEQGEAMLRAVKLNSHAWEEELCRLSAYVEILLQRLKRFEEARAS